MSKITGFNRCHIRDFEADYQIPITAAAIHKKAAVDSLFDSLTIMLVNKNINADPLSHNCC